MGQLRLVGEPPASDDHAALANLAFPQAGHTGFCSLATAQTITAEKLIDSPVGLRFGHAAGPLLQGSAAGARLSLTGDLAASGSVGIAGGTPTAARWLAMDAPTTQTSLDAIYLSPTFTNPVAALNFIRLFSIGTPLASGGSIVGLSAIMGGNAASGSTGGTLQGLNFAPRLSGGGAGALISQLTAQRLGASLSSFSGTLSMMRGIQLSAPTIGSSPSAVIATAVAIDIENWGAYAQVQTAYGLRIADITNALTKYLIEAGPATPYLRLIGGAAPGANLTNLYLNEGGTLRRVQWKDYSALVAGDRVMVLV